MSDLDSFNKSLSDMSNEELAEKLREIRLSRRTPVPKKKTSSAKTPKVDVNGISPDLAAKLLKELGE